jgi:hypothetical protein
MSPLSEELNRQIEPDSRLPSNESPRGSTRGSPRQSTAGLKAGCPNGRAASVINLGWGSAFQPGMRSVAVVPGEVEGQFLLERTETVRDNTQPSRALAFDSSNPTFNNRQAPIPPQRSKAMPNPVATTLPPESPHSELSALVRDEVRRPLSSAPESIVEKSPNRGRGRQRAIDREAHHPSREVVDGNRKPPAKWPDLGQGEGKPRDPEAECSGHGRRSTCQR